MILYQRLASGQSAETEKEALLDHLEGCDACGELAACRNRTPWPSSAAERAETLRRGKPRRRRRSLGWLGA